MELPVIVEARFVRQSDQLLSKEQTPNGLIFEAPGVSEEIFVHISRLAGKDEDGRANTFNDLSKPGTIVAIELLKQSTKANTIIGSHRRAWRKLRMAKAESLKMEQTVLDGIVTKVTEACAKVELFDGFVGVLHWSRAAGTTDEEKAERVRSLKEGDAIRCVITEVTGAISNRVSESA